MRAFVALACTALPARAKPRAGIADAAAVAREDAGAAQTAADPTRYREAATRWSSDFAFEGMVAIEAVAGGERAARNLARVLPAVDAALVRGEPGRSIGRVFGCGQSGTVLLAVAGGTKSGASAAGILGVWEMPTPREPTDAGIDAAMPETLQAGA